MKKLILLALVTLLLLPVSAWASLRISQREAQDMDFTFQNDELYYIHDYSEEIPSYLPGEPEVLQSLLVRERTVDWDGTDSGWIEHTMDFTPEVSYNQTGKQISYHNLKPGHTRVEQYDQQGRLVSLSRYYPVEYTTGSRILRFHYGDYEYPELITIGTRTEAGYASFEKYESQFDTNGLKLEEIWYMSSDSLNWTPNRKYVLHHSGDLLPDTFMPRKYNPLFDIKVFYNRYNTLQDYYSPGIYGRAVVDSIQTYDYYEGTWYPYETHIYSYGTNDNGLNIGIAEYVLSYMMYPDYLPSQYNYGFTAEGYLTGQYWGVDDGLAPPTWGSITYSWELPTSSDDPVLPPSPTPVVSAYPNPFRQNAKVNLRLTASGETKLGIYNLRGQLIRSLVDEYRTEGNHNITWDGKDSSGRELAPGIYFLRLQNSGAVSTSKLIHLK